MPDGYMDAAAVPVPDAGDDGLREQVERAIDDPGYYVDHDLSGFNGLEHSTNAVLHVVREHIAKATPERWWICTDALKDGGKKVLGPFESRDLALQVRVYVEQVNDPTTYWVDQEVAADDQR